MRFKKLKNESLNGVPFKEEIIGVTKRIQAILVEILLIIIVVIINIVITIIVAIKLMDKYSKNCSH